MQWRARQLNSLLWPLFDLSAWDQPATVLACTAIEGADLVSVHLVSVGSALHCGGVHEYLGHCSGLCSLGRLGDRFLTYQEPACL